VLEIGGYSHALLAQERIEKAVVIVVISFTTRIQSCGKGNKI
jgi:hypothetical protein